MTLLLRKSVFSVGSLVVFFLFESHRFVMPWEDCWRVRTPDVEMFQCIFFSVTRVSTVIWLPILSVLPLFSLPSLVVVVLDDFTAFGSLFIFPLVLPNKHLQERTRRGIRGKEIETKLGSQSSQERNRSQDNFSRHTQDRQERQGMQLNREGVRQSKGEETTEHWDRTAKSSRKEDSQIGRQSKWDDKQIDIHLSITASLHPRITEAKQKPVLILADTLRPLLLQLCLRPCIPRLYLPWRLFDSRDNRHCILGKSESHNMP